MDYVNRTVNITTMKGKVIKSSRVLSTDEVQSIKANIWLGHCTMKVRRQLPTHTQICSVDKCTQYLLLERAKQGKLHVDLLIMEKGGANA